MLETRNSRKAEGLGQLGLSWGHGTCLEFWQVVFGLQGLWEEMGKAGPEIRWFWRWWNGVGTAFGASLQAHWAVVRGKTGLDVSVGALGF